VNRHERLSAFSGCTSSPLLKLDSALLNPGRSIPFQCAGEDAPWSRMVLARRQNTIARLSASRLPSKSALSLLHRPSADLPQIFLKTPQSSSCSVESISSFSWSRCMRMTQLVASTMFLLRKFETRHWTISRVSPLYYKRRPFCLPDAVVFLSPQPAPAHF